MWGGVKGILEELAGAIHPFLTLVQCLGGLKCNRQPETFKIIALYYSSPGRTQFLFIPPERDQPLYVYFCLEKKKHPRSL